MSSALKRGLGLTDDIIAILVTNEVLQIAVPFVVHGSQDIHNLLPLLRVAKLDARLNHIAGELVLRVVDEIRRDQRDDPIAVLLSAMLDDMLSDIVAVLIANEVLSAAVQFLQNG